MVTYVLTILKITGIVLLVILAVVLVLLLLVLFVPIRYRADALVPETDLDKGFDVNSLDLSAGFSWLWFVIRGKISFPRDKQFTLKVFGIKILPRKEKPGEDETADKPDRKKRKTGGKVEKDDKEDKAEKNDKKENSDSKDEIDDKDKSGTESADGVEEKKDREDSAGEEKGQQEDENKADIKECAEKASENKSEDMTGSVPEDKTQDKATEDDDEYTSFLDYLWKIIDSFRMFIETPINVFEKISYTISRVCGKIDMVKSTLENDIFKRAFDLVKKKLIVILNMILPDRIKAVIKLGTGDPAVTAQILGAYGAVLPFIRRKWKIAFSPDFENKSVYADVHIKGHITVFTILYCAAIVYFNKDVKKTIRRFKKIMKK